MSYPEPEQENFLENLLRRKEFYRVRADPNHNYRDPPGGSDEYAGSYLKLHSYQLFVRDFMSPNTPYRSLHLQFQTGTGKTLVACGTAHEHIRVYKSIYAPGAARAVNNKRLLHTLDRTTPSVVVLGFGGTKKAFMRDLLKHPEFGFVSPSELNELANRKRATDSGLAVDLNAFREYQTMLKKRVTTKQRGGFYRFYGYDEFVNRLFITNGIKLVDVEAETLSRLRSGENVTHDQVFMEYIKSGKITVNNDFILSLKNSFIIADEIHNTYNTVMRNNRGVALQYALDAVESARLLTLSATPVNNSPTEIVELINYHVPKDKRITKHDLFANQRTLKKGALETIISLMRGRWSFLQDANVNYFPKQIFHGDDIILPQSAGSIPAGKPIPYLKFTPCEMSKLHADTLAWWRANSKNQPAEAQRPNVEARELPAAEIKPESVEVDASSDLSILSHFEKTRPEITEYSAENDIATDDIIIADGTTDLQADAIASGIPADGVSIYDGVFPNPDSETIGLFRSMETRAKIASAPREWLDSNDIGIRKTSLGWCFTGGFLRADKIGKYCTKAVKLLSIIDDVFAASGRDKNKCQKIMIYHDRVKMMGVMFWAELLRTNGFVDEWSDPIDATRCVVCGVNLGNHAADGCADYKPARFVVAHSDIDKTTMDTSINKFIQPENANGLQYMVLIGSKIIKESYDIKDVQVFIQTSVTVNFSTQLQIFGRTARKGSHLNLPEDQRRVNIYMLISTYAGTMTPEMQRYADKASDYIIIQQIERELNAHAIDANINRDIIMSDTLMQKYLGPDGKIQPIMGNLYFDPADTLPHYSVDELNLSTWTAYGYNTEETKAILVILKRLFMNTPAWTWEGLVSAVKRPNVGIEVNPGLFFDSNIVIALRFLLTPRNEVINITDIKSAEINIVERLFDSADRYIYVNGRRHVVVQRGKYYIRVPIQTWAVTPRKHIHGRDQEHILISQAGSLYSRTVSTSTSWLNWSEPLKPTVIQTEEWIKSNHSDDFIVHAVETINADNYVIDSNFLFNWPFAVQIYMVENAINKVNNLASKLSESTASKIIELFDQFGAIIRGDDTIDQISSGDVPIGYLDKRRVRLLVPGLTGLEWADRPKYALKKKSVYVENDILIGYIEMFDNEVRFKIRNPVQKIRGEASNISAASGYRKTASKRVSSVDTRFMERGAVCVTKPKADMIKYAANLGAPVAQFDGSHRVKTVCDIISAKLISNEIAERKKRSKIKYFYGWWDEMPTLAVF